MNQAQQRKAIYEQVFFGHQFNDNLRPAEHPNKGRSAGHFIEEISGKKVKQ